ncbi:MAG: Yip1 family protein [Tropicimonas sp.]|uniref:Yip1 family protein n=1 Tax=Tropicimonas sp. TaxID=2067044 RepID=UPI003A846DD1
MRHPLAALFQLVWQTIRAPRQTAEQIIALGIPLRALWEALVLSALLTVLLIASFLPLMAGDPGRALVAEMYPLPLVAAAGQIVNSVVSVFAVLWIGRWLGGQGRLEGAVALVAWYQLFGLCTGAILVLAGAVLPWAQIGLGLLLIAVSLVVLTQFICALHGFRNALVVFAGVVAASFGLVLAIWLVIGLLAAIFLGGTPHV